LDSDDGETDDSSFESDEDIDERVEENVNRFKIHTDSNVPDWERIKTEEDKIANEQGEKLVATYIVRRAEDIDHL
jgi:hypothetical protein